MPYPFILPTTGYISFQDKLESNSHPSLPHHATAARAVLSAALKAHKRLTTRQQSVHLHTILHALDTYVPILLALSAGLSSTKKAGEDITVNLVEEVDSDWRSTLSSNNGFPGTKGIRTRIRGLDAEIAFTLSTLARTHYLLARNQLRALHDITAENGAPGPEQRKASITGAMRQMLSASAICTYLVKLNPTVEPPVPADISPSTISALASLGLAEATLLAIQKDDPYPSLVAAARNPYDKDWMIGTPALPGIRAHLLARLCIAAAEHANHCVSHVKHSAKQDARKFVPLSSDIHAYATNLYRSSRAKACRFLGIDAEGTGQTGTAIAWLHGAMQESGQDESVSRGQKRFVDDLGASKAKSLASRFKQDWASRREDRRVAKDIDWGADAGLLEESRVLEILIANWSKLNSTVNVQIVPPIDSLLPSLPSGREFHEPQAWNPPSLDIDTLQKLRELPNMADVAHDSLGTSDLDSNDADSNADVDDPTTASSGDGRLYA